MEEEIAIDIAEGQISIIFSQKNLSQETVAVAMVNGGARPRFIAYFNFCRNADGMIDFDKAYRTENVHAAFERSARWLAVDTG